MEKKASHVSKASKRKKMPQNKLPDILSTLIRQRLVSYDDDHDSSMWPLMDQKRNTGLSFSVPPTHYMNYRDDKQDCSSPPIDTSLLRNEDEAKDQLLRAIISLTTRDADCSNISVSKTTKEVMDILQPLDEFMNKLTDHGARVFLDSCAYLPVKSMDAAILMRMAESSIVNKTKLLKIGMRHCRVHASDGSHEEKMIQLNWNLTRMHEDEVLAILEFVTSLIINSKEILKGIYHKNRVLKMSMTQIFEPYIKITKPQPSTSADQPANMREAFDARKLATTFEYFQMIKILSRLSSIQSVFQSQIVRKTLGSYHNWNSSQVWKTCQELPYQRDPESPQKTQPLKRRLKSAFKDCDRVITENSESLCQRSCKRVKSN